MTGYIWGNRLIDFANIPFIYLIWGCFKIKRIFNAIRLKWEPAYIVKIVFALLFSGMLIVKPLYDLAPDFLSLFSRAKTLITDYSNPEDSILKGIYGELMLASGRRIINNMVVTDDGRFAFYSPASDHEKRAETVIELNNYLSKRNIPMLFIRAPKKLSDPDEMPSYVTDYDIPSAEEFMKLIKQEGVHTLDLRAEMKAEGIDFDKFFWRAEHHWNSEAGFWASGKAFEALNAHYDAGFDPYYWDINNYEITVFENVMRGSQGRRLWGTGRIIGDLESVTVIEPKFETRFSYSAPVRDILTEGSFRDLFTPALNDPEKIKFITTYTDVQLAVGDLGHVQSFDNQTTKSPKKLLLLGDSFGRNLLPFMACATDIDRLIVTPESCKMLYPLLEQTEYDYVVFLMYERVIVNPGDSQRLEFGSPPQ